MKRGILALAVVGALGSSIASAETFLCRTAPDMSYTACAPAEFVSRAYVAEPSVIHTWPAAAPARPIVVERAVAVPEVSSVTITTLDNSGRSWPNTEPRVSTYRYSYGPWYYY